MKTTDSYQGLALRDVDGLTFTVKMFAAFSSYRVSELSLLQAEKMREQNDPVASSC